MINDKVEVPLEHSTEEKDLGVWTDDKLKFVGHVGHIVAKGGQLLGLIKRSFVQSCGRHQDIIYGTCTTTSGVCKMQMLCGIPGTRRK